MGSEPGGRPAGPGPLGSVDLRGVMFAPVSGVGLVQQITRRLMHAIGLGLLHEGERLPPEAQLAEWFGVSQMTLREALAVLRVSGHVETRRGRAGGTFIARAPRLDRTAVRDDLVDRDLEHLCDLTDYRRAIASEAAALAAERAEPADVDDLDRLVGEIVGTTDYYEYLRLDAKFHMGVAAASRSKRLWREQMAIEMEANGAALTGRHCEIADEFPALARDHVDLVAAIRERDPARARAIVQAHMNRSGDALIALVFGEDPRSRTH